MSRTRRRAMIYLDIDDRPCDTKKFDFEYGREYWEEGHCDYYSKKNSKWDHKSWFKPNSAYKKVKKKARKAKIRVSMQRGDYDNIPIFPMEDERDYT